MLKMLHLITSTAARLETRQFVFSNTRTSEVFCVLSQHKKIHESFVMLRKNEQNASKTLKLKSL
jgi:hypothetical protein